MRSVIAIALSLVVTPAFASHHHRHHHHFHHPRRATLDVSFGRPADCYGIPWCGCEMRHLMGELRDKSLNRARNWAHWGKETFAHIGAVVVWPHHVGKIVGGSPGHWIILSGNDGHRVRARERSIGGVIAIRERA